MARLKVLFIAGWYPSKKNPVAGVFVKEHAKAASLYNDVVVLYSEGVDRSVRGIYYIDDNVEDGLRTLRLRYRKSPVPKTSYFLYLWAIFAALRQLVREGWRPDVIHAHVYSAGFPAVLMGKLYGFPVVITEHFSGFPRGLVRGLEKMRAKFAFEQADLVCPVSENLKRNIESYGIRAQFCVLPNVVDTSLFAPGDRASTKEDYRKCLLLVALLNPIKGVPYLLEALTYLMERRNDFVLDIVGDGPNRSDYEKLATKLGLRNVVRFHGLKTKQEVAEFMRRADVFVLPSEWENLPCVIIEAMASGLPIVATNVGGIPEMVSNEVGILVPPKDSRALAQALNDVLEHLDHYQGEKIALHARQRFSYETVGKMLDNLYRKLILQESTGGKE